MITRSPDGAPPRPDLTWLRHRTLRKSLAPVASGQGAGAVTDFFSGRARRPGRSTAATPAPSPPSTASLDLSAPELVAASSVSPSLDLSAPVPVQAPSATSSLDLSGPQPIEAASGSSLDLSEHGRISAPSSKVAPPPGPTRRPSPRVGAGQRTLLDRRNPTVTLNRLQSGVGTLTVEAVCSDTVGDIRLGAFYELADGTTSIVQRATGIPAAPPGSRRPVIVGSWGQFDRLTVDLRQSRALRRLLVYAFSESGRELAWGGTLRLGTLGGSRVELALDLGRHHGPIALLSLYNIDGEFVLRAESEKVAGAVREVARVFGYHRISWADDHTPAI